MPEVITSTKVVQSFILFDLMRGKAYLHGDRRLYDAVISAFHCVDGRGG